MCYDTSTIPYFQKDSKMIMTQDQADNVIHSSEKYRDRLDDYYEATEAGHVYGLENGSVVVVTHSGSIVHIGEFPYKRQTHYSRFAQFVARWLRPPQD